VCFDKFDKVLIWYKLTKSFQNIKKCRRAFIGIPSHMQLRNKSKFCRGHGFISFRIDLLAVDFMLHDIKCISKYFWRPLSHMPDGNNSMISRVRALIKFTVDLCELTASCRCEKVIGPLPAHANKTISKLVEVVRWLAYKWSNVSWLYVAEQKKVYVCFWHPLPSSKK
jgi:hypothetical protein